MRTFSDATSHWSPKTDFQRGLAFALSSISIFGLLILAERPRWAGPWFIASLFTFAVWRLSRQSRE